LRLSFSPGVYRGGKHWVLPVDVDRRRERLQNIVRPNYVAPYAYAGRTFAPYYRHAAMYSYMTNREDARRARDFAYQDVRRAFEQFLKDSPTERPIILAGHGQGADHLTRLLQDYFQGSLKSRLAVAYVIDHPLPEALLGGPLAALKPCENKTDFGCIVAYGSFMPSDKRNAQRFSSRALVYNGEEYMAINGAKTSNLFFEDLRLNAKERTQALIATGTLPTRVRALDSLEIIDIVDSPVTPFDPSKKRLQKGAQ